MYEITSNLTAHDSATGVCEYSQTKQQEFRNCPVDQKTGLDGGIALHIALHPRPPRVVEITPVRPYLEVGAPRKAALVAMLCYAMLG